ncbi:hypothetical protein FHR81_005376 [Actinoalloteichus hoggarensis]|uniref:Chitinase n=1 Tax=Actinoalloteichus hoggarensis TaxID=1470176 RepID=A0A221VWP6_9PSEU|nr:carbohydrate-binding protein [Actinoalloteichus hoggarensis]ASO17887.1 Chitinase precursor [Actinoalloteichus hoggarensis]MBB5924299.1 hypothetical protein [Actinoalloteichus hoggarensis]
MRTRVRSLIATAVGILFLPLIGGGPAVADQAPAPGATQACAAPAWNAGIAYVAGDRVSHGGAEWRAKWWTQGETPGTTGEWGVWEHLGACGGPEEPGEPADPGAIAVAPYLYYGWGNPPSAVEVMNATGVEWFTMAFILSSGGCTPSWDGQRPLTGGIDEQRIDEIRAAGGDVIPSIGGWNGNKLGESCQDAASLAAAYQQVIDAFDLKAIDLDIENTEFYGEVTQQRNIDALSIIARDNPDLLIYITMGTAVSGPDSNGRRLIQKGAAAGLDVDGWTIMPFNFNGSSEMGQDSIRAAEGLQDAVRAAYGYSETEAYQRIGISSMNGMTDQGETVTQQHFREMLGYAQQHGLARLTFWSVNRDRPCTGGDVSACSGIGQRPWEFTGILAEYLD